MNVLLYCACTAGFSSLIKLFFIIIHELSPFCPSNSLPHSAGQDKQLCGSKLFLGLNRITIKKMKYICSKNTQRDVTYLYLYKQKIKVLISKKPSEEARSRDLKKKKSFKSMQVSSYIYCFPTQALSLHHYNQLKLYYLIPAI